MTSATPRPLSVLFVDDDEISRIHFARAVEGRHPVHLARDVEEALATLNEHGADIAVLVTDFRMPVRDGDALLREVARHYPQIVRILVTAYADKDMLLQTVNTGNAFRILEKPLRRKTVQEVLQLAIARYTERETRRRQLQAMDETLAFLVHELNTPLATIALFAQSIGNQAAEEDDSQQPDRIARAAASMLSNTQYCQALISSFWTTLHRDSGVQSLSRDGARNVDATRLIGAVLDTYPLSAAQRDWITLNVEADFAVRAMPNCVALVLSSLLTNALRALADVAAPRLVIEVSAQAEPQIRFRDNGPGIAAEVGARLLRDPVTTHAEDGGHGMGMIFCDRIMRSFGGSLRIDSVPGSGTTVTLSFGAAEARTPAPEPERPNADQSPLVTSR
ncbi:hybrid sensor histidine kinase/response regulator [Paraburkholderia acidipaludis]|uniref:hybrid sensor histidine kinase/response regulator n=1 Tax=Paraburkholderia acidipaludis TaxID=660537 RepID=UPI0005B94575|nr:hybrid sensor histidine kinase/response regulator [Paraburkholderia acidipaludis]